MLEKLNDPRVTLSTFLAIIGMIAASFVWIIGYAEDMSTLKAQIPAIKDAQRVESEHQKERYDDLKERSLMIQEQQIQIQQQLNILIQQSR